jgi:hypothetical protein
VLRFFSIVRRNIICKSNRTRAPRCAAKLEMNMRPGRPTRDFNYAVHTCGNPIFRETPGWPVLLPTHALNQICANAGLLLGPRLPKHVPVLFAVRTNVCSVISAQCFRRKQTPSHTRNLSWRSFFNEICTICNLF